MQKKHMRSNKDPAQLDKKERDQVLRKAANIPSKKKKNRRRNDNALDHRKLGEIFVIIMMNSTIKLKTILDFSVSGNCTH